MHVGEAIRQALRTLRAERLRTFLTLFGVVWGTASVVFLLSWGLGVQRMLEAGFSRAGKNLVQAWAGKIGEDFTPAVDRRELWLTLDDVDVLRRRTRLADAVAAESRLWSRATRGERVYSVDLRGVQPLEFELRGAHVAAGRPITATDVRQRRRVAVIGSRARRTLFGAAPALGETIRIEGQAFAVVGILGSVGTQLWRDDGEELDEQVWIPLATMFGFGPRRGRDAEVVDSILLRLRRRQDYPALQREVRAILAARLRVSPTDEEAILLGSPLDMLQKLPIDQTAGLLFTLGATTLLIGGVGILNMMLDAVQERRQEIGVRLAVGARPRDVLGQFFLETVVITGLGGLLGVALGVGGCWALAQLETPDLIPVPILRGWIVALALAVMSGVGIGAGLIPAWRAARTDPSLTLRVE